MIDIDKILNMENIYYSLHDIQSDRTNLELIAEEAPHLVPALIDIYIMRHYNDLWIRKYEAIHTTKQGEYK